MKLLIQELDKEGLRETGQITSFTSATGQGIAYLMMVKQDYKKAPKKWEEFCKWMAKEFAGTYATVSIAE